MHTEPLAVRRLVQRGFSVVPSSPRRSSQKTLHDPYTSPVRSARGREFPNKLASAKLTPGVSIKWTNDDGVMLVKWCDRRDVYMIATNDEGLDVVRQVRRNNMPCDMPTPCCVRKYNSLMGGVDRMDQLRSYYSVGTTPWWMVSTGWTSYGPTRVWAVLPAGGGNTSSGACWTLASSTPTSSGRRWTTPSLPTLASPHWRRGRCNSSTTTTCHDVYSVVNRRSTPLVKEDVMISMVGLYTTQNLLGIIPFL